MERIGVGRVGISRSTSTTHPHVCTSISSSFVVNSSSSRFNIEAGANGNSGLPVSLPIIVIDHLPRVCLKAFRPKRPSSSKRGIKPHTTIVSAAASLTAVSSPPIAADPSCVKVTVVDTLVDDHGNPKPQPRRRSRTRDAPRRKRKTSVNPIVEVLHGATSDPELQRLAEALESAYHKDATTHELDYESILNDLEAQTRIVGEMAGGSAVEVSCSSPTMSSVRKRRGRPPRGSTVVHLDQHQQQTPSVISPQTTKDGFIVRSVPSVVVKRRVGEGKCRLNLRSRIALRKRSQDRSLKVNEACTTLGIAAQDIWFEEAEYLIAKHGMALELGVVDWDNLKRGLLSAEEESELAILMKPMKAFRTVRKAWIEEMGRDPTDEEWAAAAQMDVHTLRRHLHLGKAARNKLIQHNLRLVLSQANKYYRENSCLSLFDLCQEGVSGLLRGVDKFDPQRGHRFSTYAVYWVRNSILRAQTRSGSSVRSPYNVAMHKLNIKRARLDLLVELERAPTDDEVMERLGLARERFRDIVNSSVRTGSMNRKSNTTGEELVETVADRPDAERVGVPRSGDDASLRFGVNDVLDSLKPREGLVLRQRFGLDGQGERTLGEIGQTLGLSREMVRKYEACALMKLKHPTRMDYLRSYLS
ncbi:unnamed protein product [Calypogeia fissa]